MPRRREAAAADLPRTRWAQTPDAFRRLLAWLDQGIDSGGQTYLEMRRRLVGYFDRKRCLTPDDLADESLNRVARRLEEKSGIDVPPAKYCYVVARYVFLEYLRRGEHRQRHVEDERHDGLGEQAAESTMLAAGDGDVGKAPLDVLDDCLQRLGDDDRELILGYYHAQGSARANRRALALRLELTANALAIRACRIRALLEACMNRSLGT